MLAKNKLSDNCFRKRQECLNQVELAQNKLLAKLNLSSSKIFNQNLELSYFSSSSEGVSIEANTREEDKLESFFSSSLNDDNRNNKSGKELLSELTKHLSLVLCFVFRVGCLLYLFERLEFSIWGNNFDTNCLWEFVRQKREIKSCE